MPGIVDPCFFGLHREVGKMTYQNPDIAISLLDLMDDDCPSNLDALTQYLNSDKPNPFIECALIDDSPPSSSSSSPSQDNIESEGELPESENAYDFNGLLDPLDLSGSLLSDSDNSHQAKECSGKLKQPSVNPFMGPEDKDSSASEAFMNHLDDQHNHHSSEGFVAWGHSPVGEDEEQMLMLITNPFQDDEEETNETLPDTPSSYSGTVTGDDSDVDIETITDNPRTADSCGYATHDSSPALSPVSSPSPLQSHATSNSALHRSHSSPLFPSSSTNGSQPLIRFNSFGVSNSASLAENLMCGRPTITAQKRKIQREKKSHTASFHHTFQTSGPSVNFHDYAMSPISSPSLDTAQPTVLSSKRLCKRRQLNTLDLSEKEKQHHHNQLERNRRQKLADLFIDLRDEVPNIAHQTKASKVMILNQATSYIEDLQKRENNQVNQISREKERNRDLRRQLQSQLSCME